MAAVDEFGPWQDAAPRHEGRRAEQPRRSSHSKDVPLSPAMTADSEIEIVPDARPGDGSTQRPDEAVKTLRAGAGDAASWPLLLATFPLPATPSLKQQSPAPGAKQIAMDMPGSWRSDRPRPPSQPSRSTGAAHGDSSPTLPGLVSHRPEHDTPTKGALTPSPHSSLSSASVLLQTPFESTSTPSATSPSDSRYIIEDEHETSACLDPAPPLPALSPVQHADGRSLQRPFVAAPLNRSERSATLAAAQKDAGDAQGPDSPPPRTPLPPCPFSSLPSLKSPVGDSAPHVPSPPAGGRPATIRRDLSLPISLHDIASGKRSVQDLHCESGSKTHLRVVLFLFTSVRSAAQASYCVLAV